ncbi:sterol desaturase family protein [Aurantiacibacter sediminis]|uniref:Beta-carotene hydroxylase n=1 Tax=Aurantiacibacter sediminis TaxID=2793064 RepID=A0ABS0N5Z1_9SPHN|nr:sterol desaturase family protein [Aurantiacibacter sediminis]MBH5323224.1 beta-carotene hydroxylase [Aurantiacibacter sediminis]
MDIIVPILVVIATILAMEVVAWSSHKYIMHGWGWGWHRDHHEPHNNLLEKNDLYGIVGAVMSISMFMWGWPVVAGEYTWPMASWIGVGILGYGIIYTLIHDGLVHQRYFKFVPKKGYAKRLVQAHKLHHATVGKEGGVSFGFLFAQDPAKLKAELRRQRETGTAELRESAGI